MRDCLILGSGRSGTSMVTGTLARAGYYMGEGLYPARTANPKGFFECQSINGINEALMAPHLSPGTDLRENQLWLGALEPDVEFEPSEAVVARIRAETAHRPWCFKDPRFSFTLPAWRKFIGDAGLVCVFRDPRTTVHSILREVRTAEYLDTLQFDRDRAFRLWTATYKAVLHHREIGGDWLFLHYDQVLEPAGMGRLGAFLNCSTDSSFPDNLLRRTPPDIPVPAEVLSLYDELCELAHRKRERPRPFAAPHSVDVSVLAVVRSESDIPSISDLRTRLADQRSARGELVVVDASEDGLLADTIDGAISFPTWSHPDALLHALKHANGRYVALAVPGMLPLPSWLAHATTTLDQQPDANIFLPQWWISEPPERFVRRLEPREGHDPPAGWEGAAVWRKEALASLPRTAFHPVLLERYREYERSGKVARSPEPLAHLNHREHQALEKRLIRESAVLSTRVQPWSGAPAISVIICSFNRHSVLRDCLEAFCAQELPRAAFELVVVDDGSTDRTPGYLNDLQLAVQFTHIRRENGGLAAARNTGIGAARGHLLHFVNDDTIPAPDNLIQHISAHAHHKGKEPIAVLGSFRQPPSALRNALMRVCEVGTLVFCFSELVPGKLHHPRYFYTCNVSAPASLVREAGGFEEAFRHYGAEDTDLGYRLGKRGMRVLFHPSADALHYHTWGFEYVQRRSLMVARAHIRLFRRQPEAMDVWNLHHVTKAELAQRNRANQVAAERFGAAAAALCSVDVGALEDLGEQWKGFAENVTKRLDLLLNAANGHWWTRGFCDGLEEHGYASFADLLAEHPVRPELPPGPLAVLLPQKDGDWRTPLLRYAASGPTDFTLAVRAHKDVGLPRDILEAWLKRNLHGTARRRIVVFETDLHLGQDYRLLAGSDAWLPSGSALDDRFVRVAGRTDTTVLAIPS